MNPLIEVVLCIHAHVFQDHTPINLR
jgi:hypothetical protein